MIKYKTFGVKLGQNSPLKAMYIGGATVAPVLTNLMFGY
jgi:hypothetical protein